MNILFFLVLFIVFNYLNTFSTPDNLTQKNKKNKIILENILALGDDESKPVEYLFEEPRFVLTDSKNNIYVAEMMEMAIRVYNKNGEFIRKIGRRGRGPGEFLDFTLVYINSKDIIIVFDNFSARISFFSKDGKFIKQQPYFFNEISWPRGICELNDGKYVLSYKLEDESFPLHIFSKDLKQRISKIDEYPSLKYKDNILDETFSSLRSNSLTVDKTGNIFFAKRLYNGKIYCYNNKGKWQISQILTGVVHKNPPYTRFSSNESTKNKNNKKRFDFIAHNSGKSIIANIHNESMGLYKLSTGELIHFTIIEKNRTKILGAEVYDSKLNFIKYYIIDEKKRTGDVSVNFNIRIISKDNMDNFYLVDNSKFPTIKKVRLKFEQ